MKCKNCNREFDDSKASRPQLRMQLGPGCYEKYINDFLIKSNSENEDVTELEDGLTLTGLGGKEENDKIVISTLAQDFYTKLIEHTKENTKENDLNYYYGVRFVEGAHSYACLDNNLYFWALRDSIRSLFTPSDKNLVNGFPEAILGAGINETNVLEKYYQELDQYLHIHPELNWFEQKYLAIINEMLGEPIESNKMARDYALNVYDNTYKHADAFMKLRFGGQIHPLNLAMAAAYAEELCNYGTYHDFADLSRAGLIRSANNVIIKDLIAGASSDYNRLATESVARILASRDYLLTSASDNGSNLISSIAEKAVEKKILNEADAKILEAAIKSHGKGEKRYLSNPYGNYNDYKRGLYTIQENGISKQGFPKHGKFIYKQIDQSPDDLIPALKPLKLSLVDGNYAITSGSLATAAFTPIISKLKKENGVDAIVTTVVNGKISKIDLIKSEGKFDRLADYNPLKAYAALKHSIVSNKYAPTLDGAIIKHADIKNTFASCDFYVTLPGGNNNGNVGHSEVYRLSPVGSFDHGDNSFSKDVYDITRTWVHNPEVVKKMDKGNSYFNLSGKDGFIDKTNVARVYQPTLSKGDFELVKGQKYSLSGGGWVADASKGDEDTLRFAHGTHQATSDILKEISLKKGTDEKYLNEIMTDFNYSAKTIRTMVEGLDLFESKNSKSFAYDEYKNTELIFPKRNNNKASRQSGSED